MNRQQRRANVGRCRLLVWPRYRALPIQGLVLSAGQTAYTCAAHPGWLSITSPLDIDVQFAQHTGRKLSLVKG